ncbi:MAG: HD domain-containing protein [Gemmatimonadaceae bacterium]|jgi:putative nucleotidyltransferase with HDIG domain|nr:HD domain-containing protein [Gemmatimonadaceae bacterium]
MTMNPIVLFLTTLGQAMASHTLYADGHPVRTAARDKVFIALSRLLRDRQTLRLSFLDNRVIVGSRVLAELRGWEWGPRFAAAGIQRLEFDAVPPLTADDVELLISELHTRLASHDVQHVSIAMRSFRFGPLGVAGNEDVIAEETGDLLDAMAQLPMSEETSAVRWIHDEIASGGHIPMAEVEAVVHSLAMAMHREQHLVMPLLDIKTYDQYTTVHSCNVSMLSIGLAEQLGLPSKDARAIGTAALLHDIGKVRVPTEILVKPGKLTDAEFAFMRAHPTEGAKILSERSRGNELAIAVAYEHHIWDNGRGGYPGNRWQRRCHYASRLVHVCDLFDALSTKRPYRDAWSQERTMGLLKELAGVEIDREMVDAFGQLIARAEVSRTAPTEDEQSSGWSADVAETARQMHGEAALAGSSS